MSSTSETVASVIARLIVRIRAEGPLLELAARTLRRRPRSRIAASLGWHLGQQSWRQVDRVAHLRSGGLMVVDVRDYAHRNIFLFGTYEERITSLLHRVARPGWTVVDIGANAGYHSLLAADLGGSSSRVVAFEPSPQMGELLRRSMKLNPRAQIELVSAACGDHEGQAGLILSEDPHNAGLASVRYETPSAYETVVTCVRLDTYCATHDVVPDLIKIDVEGAEPEVLRGAESLLRGSPPEYVICEVWPESREEVFGYMRSFGYLAHGIAPDGSLTEPAEPGPDWSDVCFRHLRGAATSDLTPGSATIPRAC